MAAMDIDITVPTDKINLNKTITISVNPANKNVTAGGSCGPAKNATKQVRLSILVRNYNISI